MDNALVPIDVVVNPAAKGGQAARKLDLIGQELRVAGYAPTIHSGADASETSAIIEALIANGPQRVLVVGGDGIVHLAANVMAGSMTALGIIAAGSGNDAARALGLPLRGREAVQAALGPPILVDVLEADGAVAVTVATAGFTEKVNKRANAMSRAVRPASYVLATLAELPTLRHRRIALDIDGQRWEFDCALLVIANTAYFGGGMKVAPKAAAFDGVLQIIVGMGSSRLRYARLLTQVFSGSHLGDSYVLELTAKTVTVTALDGAPLQLWADGEPWISAPVTVSCRPEALLVAGAGSNR